jgi:hypothetical protein
MLHFVQSVIDIGISLGRASPIVTSESLFPSISAKKVTRMIRSSGEVRAEEILYQFQGKRFVNLICDAGTVQTFHTLYALVTNPYSETPALVADMIDSTGFSADPYAIILKTLFFHSSRMSLLSLEPSLIIWRLNLWDCAELSSLQRIKQCEQLVTCRAFVMQSI